LACSQKKRKLALSTSSKSGSSRREEDVGAGTRVGLTISLLKVADAGKMPRFASETHPPNLAICFNSSRREFLISISINYNHYCKLLLVFKAVCGFETV
jgi:hypothetical protein